MILGRVILGRLPATLELAVAALAISVVAGIGIGVLSVWRRGSWLESASIGVGTLGIPTRRRLAAGGGERDTGRMIRTMESR